MQFVNHYSAPILWLLLLAGGSSLVIRRGGKSWIILGVAAALLAVAWWFVRPVAELTAAVATKPSLLEVQSPFCLGCLAQKSSVDRLEREFQNQLVVRRVDIQSDEGKKLADQYGIERTPSFIFLDANGEEQWRTIGKIEEERLRNSLQSSAK